MTQRSLGSLIASTKIDRSGFNRDLQTLNREARSGNLAVNLRAKLDTTGIQRDLNKMPSLQARTISVKLNASGGNLDSEIRRLQGRGLTLNIKFGNLQTATTEINSFKTLLGGLQSNMQYRVTVNTTALQAVYTNINTQITALQSLISQLRALGNGGGGGGGGAGGQGGLSAGTRQLLGQLEALNNQWKRGEIGAAALQAALTPLQAQLRTAAGAVTAGSAEFKALDAGLTRLTGSLRSINTDAFQKIKTEAAALRTAFDAATAGVTRNSAQFRAAMATFATGSTALQGQLQALVASGRLTEQQLGMVTREIGRMTREAATVAGSVNAGGLSGNMFNALRAAFPIIGQMGGALGSAAGQAGMFGSAIGSAAAAFGPLGIVIGVTTVAVGLLTAGIMSAVNEYGKFEAQMQGVKAVSGATGETFDKLKDQAKELALEFGLNVNEIGKVQEELFKAGRGVEDVMGGAAKAVTVLMRATGSDLNNAVTIAGASMNTFGISGSNMMRVADAIASGANKTALDVNTLGVALQQVGNVASGAGLSLEETVAVLGLMADRGIRGSDAGTSLKVMMQRLTSGMPEVVEGLNEFNLKVYDGTGAQRDMITVLSEVIGAMDKMTDEERGAFLQKVAGSDAQRVLTASYQAGTNSLKDYIAMMDDRGRAEKDAKTRMEGLQGAQAKLNTTFQVFKDTVGEVFAPAVTTLVNAATAGVASLTSLFEWLDKLDKRTAEVEKTALGKELEALQKRLVGEQSQLRSIQQSADAQAKRTGGVSEPTQARLDAQLRTVAELVAQVKVLELQARTEAVQNGTFVGPVRPGQDDGGTGGLALTASGADALGAMVVSASAGKLGDVSADSIVNFCAKWVRLTLDKAAPGAEAKINALFQTDSNGDGRTEATDAARNLLKAGFAQQYSGVKDLKPGDVVFYTENGQNHTGIYVGDGMVRGNNRVTYAANGGKFDKYGNAISPGVNPVGDVAIGKLGTPNWIVRPGDMLPALGVKPPKPENVKAQGEDDGVFTAAQVIQAQKLVAALEKADKALKAKQGDVGLTKVLGQATAELEKFSKASDSNGAALKAVQSGLSGAKKAAGEYIASQAELNKYGADALRLIKAQEAAQKSGSAEAIRTAKANMDAWQGENEGKAAVVQIEQAAYQSRKAATEQAKQEAKKNETEQATIAKNRAQFEKEVNAAIVSGRVDAARKALEGVKQAQADEITLAGDSAAKKAQIVKATSPQILKAEADIARAVRGQAITAAEEWAKLEREKEGANLGKIETERKRRVQQAYNDEAEAGKKAQADQTRAIASAGRDQAKEDKARAKEQNALRAKYAAERRDLDVQEAQATLTRTQELNKQELDAFKGSAAQKVALIKRQAQDEYDATEQAERAKRDKAVREFQNAAGPNMTRNIAGANQAYTDAVGKAGAKQTQDGTKAAQDQTKAIQDAREGYAKLAEGMRDKITAGKVEIADLAAYLKAMTEADTAAQKGGVNQENFIIQARASAQAVYQSGIDAQIAAGMFGDLADGHDRASRAAQGYVATQEDALAQIPGSTEANAAYLKVIQDLEAAGKLAAGTVALVSQAMRDQEVIAANTAAQMERLTSEAGKTADQYVELGDSGAALQTLESALDAAMDAAMRGEDAAAAIAELTDKINELSASTAVKDGFNQFVAGLGGTIEEQISQVVDQLDRMTDPAMIAKLKALLADLRQGVTAYEDPSKAGYAPNSNGGGFTGQPASGLTPEAIAAARDLTQALNEELDPAALGVAMTQTAELLASEVGQKLPDATKKALADGVENAKAYQDALASITADGVQDGINRTLNKPTIPTNEYTDWATKIFDLGSAGLGDDTTMDALTQSLNDARAAGKLTEDELQNLLAIIAEFRTDKGKVEIDLSSPLEQWKKDIDTLTAKFDNGQTTAQEYSAELNQMGDELKDLAAAARAAGNPALAAQFEAQADALKQMSPAVVEALQKMNKLVAFLDNVKKLAGAFGELAGAMGEAEQEYDSVTGEALQTPWTDLAANLDGAANAASRLMDIATDVMKIIANPADIGAWIGAITKLISGIAEAIGGFQKAKAAVAQNNSDFSAANPLLRSGDYQKSYTQSRGWLADTFGGGPRVVNEIDKIGLPIAQGISSAIFNGMDTGYERFQKSGRIEDFSKAMEESLSAGVKNALFEAYKNDPQRQNTYGDSIKEFSDAVKSKDPERIARARERLSAAYKSDLADTKLLFEQLDQLERETGTGKYSPEAIAAQQRDLTDRRLSNEQAGVELLYKKGLLSAEEYEARKLKLAQDRIRLEMESALAAEGLTQDQIALIREQYDIQLQTLQATADAEARQREVARAKDIADRTLNNAELALEIERKTALMGAQTDEERYQLGQQYDRRRLELTLKRLEAEMVAALAAEGLTQAQIDLIREQYALKARDAQISYDAQVAEHQRQLAQEAQQRAEALKAEQDGILNTWAGSATAGFMDALEKGDFSSFFNKWRADLTQATVQAIVQAELGRIITDQLRPLAERYRAALQTPGFADDLAALRDLREGVRTVTDQAKPLFDAFAPLFADLKSELAANTEATRDNTDAVKDIEFQATTVTTFARPAVDSNFREQLARYV